MADRDVTVRLRADISQYSRQLAAAAAQTSAFGKSTDGAGKEIDKLSGRLRLATDAALILGPALGPLGAAAVGGVVALSAQLGSLAGALGVTLLAVNGLGDGLKALDKYQLDPTAENLKKLNQEMGKLGPAGEDFVRFIDSIEPNLKTLQTAAREGLFPGAEEGIQSLLQRLPEVRKLIRGLATEMGDLAAEGGKALAGPGFDAFFKYLRTDGVKLLDDTSKTIGNLAESVANLFVAFGGVSTDFSGGLLKFSQGLAEASANLDSNAGFIKFVDYIQTEGPHALETIESIANAFLQIVEATAPLGGPVLTVLGKFADIIAAIADSDLGTPIFAGLAALALYNRALQVTTALQGTAWAGAAIGNMKAFRAELTEVTTAQDRARMSAQELDAANARSAAAWKGGISTLGKSAALVGGLALATSGLAEQTGLSNTASLAMMGTIAGPWGAAVGGGIGALLDFKGAYDDLNGSISALDTATSSGDIEQLTAQIAAAKKKLDDLQSTSGTEALAGGILGGLGLQSFATAEDQIGHVTGKTDDLSDSIKRAQAELTVLKEKNDNLAAGIPTVTAPLAGLRAGMEKAAEAAQEQEAAINGAIQAMHDMREEALRAANAELDYQQAVDDATQAVKENGKTHDKTTEKGRNNLRALYDLAGAWNGQSEVIKGNSKKLQEARGNFVAVAGSMGISAAAARKLSRDLFDIPEKRQTKITTDTSDAEAGIQAVKSLLFGLHDKTINVRVNQIGGVTSSAGGHSTDAPGGADGMTVPGPRHPYGDKLTIRVAPGEEIISNRHGQADRFRADRASGRIPGYAGGGTAGGDGRRSRPFTLFTSAAGAEVIDSAHGLAQALKMLQAALAKSEKSLDKERTSRDNAQQAYDSFVSSVGGAYSTKDPFAAAEATGGLWAAGGGMGNPLSSFDSALSSNIANTQAAQAALSQAAGNGLNGPLYQALAQSGNLQLLQAFAGLSSSQIDQREQQFAAQSNAQSALGTSAAASAGLTQQLVDANKELATIRDEVKGLRRDVKQADNNNQAAQKQNAKDVKDGVNGAASGGRRRAH